MLLSESDYQVGRRCKADGKEGTIVERYANEVRVKFLDGEFGFFNLDQVECLFDETTLKSYEHIIMLSDECPFCKGSGLEISKNENIHERAFQCTKCNQRYSKDDPKIKHYKGMIYCNHCGKLTAKHVGEGKYECKSCDNIFKN